MKLGEFFIDLVVNAGEGRLTLGELVKSMGELEAVTIGQLGALFALAEKLADMTEEATHSAHAMHLFTTMTGLSSQKLQEFDGVAMQAGVGAGVMQRSVEGITASIANMKANLGDGKLLTLNRLLGIDLNNKDAFQILEDLRKSTVFKNMSPAQKNLIMGQTSIDPQMLLYLDLTNKKRDEFRKTTAVMSKEQEHDLVHLSQLMATMAQRARAIELTLVKWNTPALLRSLSEALRLIELIQNALDRVHSAQSLGVQTLDKINPGAGSDLAKILPPGTLGVIGMLTAELAKQFLSGRGVGPSTGPVSPDVMRSMEQFLLSLPQTQPVQNNIKINAHVNGVPYPSTATVDTHTGADRLNAMQQINKGQ